MPILSKEFLNIQATRECKLTLKHVCDMIRTYIQIVNNYRPISPEPTWNKLYVSQIDNNFFGK